MRAATGVQHQLSADTPVGPATAVITELAAGIRQYTVNGVDLVETFPRESAPPKGSGIVLVPWPNRIRDGAWTHNGATLQLALTEPAKQNASHGLLRYTSYRLSARTPGSVTLAATVFPQPGYPFQLDTTVSYSLTDDGLEVSHAIVNVGDTPAPVAVGAHPFLRLGETSTEVLTLRVAADTHLEVDDRQIPVSGAPVEGTVFDLREGRRVGELDLDDGYSGVTFERGRCEHSLTGPHGRQVVLWGDENFRYVQVFTPRTFPNSGTDGVHQAVAIEPMTAPANAFNSGDGLRWLAPGEEWSPRWGIRHEGLAGGS
jgi:aldose 1-epimerase